MVRMAFPIPNIEAKVIKSNTFLSVLGGIAGEELVYSYTVTTW